MNVPDELVEVARGGPFAAEVAAGRRFDTALDLAMRAGVRVLVTDRDARVLEAPRPLDARVDDLHHPRLDLYRGCGLLYAVRIPEELQAAAARLARRVDAPLALRPLKDEYADVRPIVGPAEVLPGGWRLHRPNRE